jgi:hypothetical protein
MAALEPVIAEHMKREPAHLVAPVLLEILTGYMITALKMIPAGPERERALHRAVNIMHLGCNFFHLPTGKR